jgi:uncharacterized membrane protein YphA (DoxX/SURF4 family)
LNITRLCVSNSFANHYTQDGGVSMSHAEGKRPGLLRLISTYPGGLSGMGLLLLRLSVGIIAVIQGMHYLDNPPTLTGSMLSIGSIAIASGVMLLLGFLTPASGSVIGLGIIGIALAWIPSAVSNLFEGSAAPMLAASVSAAIVLLGPGAYSLDARLFGRRQIIIPPISRSRA